MIAVSNMISLRDFHVESARYYVYCNTKSRVAHVPHYHDYFQLCYLTAGKVRHCQGDDEITLHAGEAFIIPPGFVHSLHFTTEHTKVYNIAFHETLFGGDFLQTNAFRFLTDLQHCCDTGAVPLSLSPDPAQRQSIEALIDCLLRQQEAECPQEMSAAPSLILSIVYLLTQCYYRDPRNKRQPWSRADDAQLLRRCIAYVDTHFTRKLNSDTLSKQFGLSRTAFCSMFQQRTGMSLHKYISQKRIQKAQLLIRSHGELALGQIAAQVGYEDDSTFYRNFLKVTGMTPSAYRDQFHGNKSCSS